MSFYKVENINQVAVKDELEEEEFDIKIEYDGVSEGNIFH